MIKMVNYIKSEAAILRVGTFKIYELREELIICFTFEESELADLLSDETWCNKVAFLADLPNLEHS
jgi:hypothetical protein